jgi:hypothetical protein
MTSIPSGKNSRIFAADLSELGPNEQEMGSNIRRTIKRIIGKNPDNQVNIGFRFGTLDLLVENWKHQVAEIGLDESEFTQVMIKILSVRDKILNFRPEILSLSTFDRVWNIFAILFIIGTVILIFCGTKIASGVGFWFTGMAFFIGGFGGCLFITLLAIFRVPSIEQCCNPQVEQGTDLERELETRFRDRLFRVRLSMPTFYLKISRKKESTSNSNRERHHH